MSENNNTPDLNEAVTMTVEDATVIAVNIDDTLTVSGDAADAYAVGQALALKADKSELQNAITVNGQGADAQGVILIDGTDIPMSSTDSTTLKAAVEAVDGKTAEDIPMSDDDTTTIAEAISGSVLRTADQIAMSSADPTTVKAKIDALDGSVATLAAKTAADIVYSGTETIKQHVDAIDSGLVKSVYGTQPDANGDVSPAFVPYADNLTADESTQSDAEFIARTTGGSVGINGNKAWLMHLYGNSVHTGYTAESKSMTVSAMPRPAPAAITAVIDNATFEAYVETAGTYTLTYTDSWSDDPTDYGITVSNTPIDGDEISVVWDGENDPVMTVSPAERHGDPEITATIDWDTFKGYVTVSGTTTLTYTTGWSSDPTLYGITVSNTPVAGDQIVITYVKEVRGTITTAQPTKLTATGWNLYDHANQYARVLKYSNTYGYIAGGDYTALSFVTAIGETPSTITPDASGRFTVPSDGYVLVSDGNNTDTYITPTWSDWMSGPTVDFQTYTEDGIDLLAIMSARFPYGLCKVGTVYDEIDLNARTATSRIQRMAYTAENLAIAQASGRAYEYDEDYIYLVRATPTINAITTGTEYTCDDHGFEIFEGTTIAVGATILYGTNLKDKLRRQVVTYDMTVSTLMAMGT